MGLAAFNRSRRAAAEAAQKAAEAARKEQEEFAQKAGAEEQVLEVLREKAKSLGIENAGRKGEERLKEEVASAEASIKKAKEEADVLRQLKESAAVLGIETEGKDAETLQAKIASKEGDSSGY